MSEKDDRVWFCVASGLGLPKLECGPDGPHGDDVGCGWVDGEDG